MIPSLQISWNGKVFLRLSSSGNILSARLKRSGPIIDPITVEANWTEALNGTLFPGELSVNLLLGTQSLLSLQINSSSLNE